MSWIRTCTIVAFLLLISISTALADTVLQEWDFPYSRENWTTGGTTFPVPYPYHHNADGWPGIIYAYCDGTDPQFISPTFSQSATSGQKVVVQIATHGGSSHTMQIFWKRSGDSGFSESRSMSLSYYASSGISFKTLEFDVGGHPYWSGTITQIRVDPSKNFCNTSDPTTFHINEVQITEVPTLSPPNLVAPINNTTVSSRTLYWQQVSGATGYELSVDGQQVLIYSGSTTNYTPSIGYGYHQWQARTKNSAGVYGPWSSLEGFYYQEATLPAPNLTSPINNSTVFSSTLYWQQVSGAAGYELWVDGQQVLIYSGSTTNYTASIDYGYHQWKARTKNSSGNYGDWSSTEGFYYQEATLSPPNLISPINNQSVTTPILYWQQVSGAAGYELRIDGQQVLIHSGYTTSYTASLGFGYHEWQARTENSSGAYGSWSSLEGFYYVDDLLPPPVLVSPVDNAVVSSTVLQWQQVSGATGYELDVDGNQVLINSGSTTSYNASLTYGPHDWSARTKNGSGDYGPWGGVESFTYQMDFGLVSPSNGGTVSTSDVDFVWENAGATRYEFIVDNDPDFGSPEINPLYHDFAVRTTTSKNIEPNWLSPGTWYWKVKAVMPDGTEVWSDRWSFTFTPPEYAEPDWSPFYRLYSPAEKNHFYVTNVNHQGGALKAGYDDEGVEGHVSYWPFAGPNMVPIFRFWHTDFLGGHYYTAGSAARDLALTDPVMQYEGIVGYAYNAPLSGLVPLYHLQKDNVDGSGRRDNVYTISEFERHNAVTAYEFTDMGPICWVSPVSDLGSMPWSPYTMLAGLGVNPDNGNFKHAQSVDFDIPGIGLPLRFSHQYNSRTIYYPDQLRSLSPGWSHDYSSCVTEAAGLLYVTWANGEIHLYDQGTEECLVDGVYDDLDILGPDQVTIRKKNQILYTFERPAAGYPMMLKEIRDRNDNALTCTYSQPRPGEYRLTRVTGPAGRHIDLVYYTSPGKEGLLHTVTDPLGRQISFDYWDDTFDLRYYTDPEGYTTEYIYDDFRPFEHQLARIELPDGTDIDNTYDDARKLASQRWSGQTGGMDFQYSGDVTTITYLNGKTMSTTFTPAADVLQPRMPASVTQGSATTHFNYDHAAHPTLPSSIVDPAGNSHVFFYDPAGNMTEESHPHGSNTQYLYDTFNNITRVTDPMSNQIHYGYDTAGNLTSITMAAGEVTNLGRNGQGQLTSVSDAEGTTSFTYDGYGNLTQATDPLGHSVNLGVDIVGRVTSVTDALGNSTTYQVDNRGLVTKVTDPMGGIMNVSYDQNGQLTQASGPGTTTQWIYDRGFMSSYHTPSHPTSYSYNADGTLDRRDRPNGTTNYLYDDARRLETINGANRAILGRDANGNITSVSDELFNLTYTYDGLNRVLSSTDHWGNTVNYDYDRNGNTILIDYGSGKDVHYRYDANNRLISVSDWAGNSVSYTYTGTGRVASVNYSNGTFATLSYDAVGRLTGLVNTGSTEGVIASYDYTLDSVGNQTGATIVEPMGPPEVVTASSTFTVNSFGQVTSDGSTTYAYDAQGNLGSMSGARNLDLTFDQDNRLTSFTGGASGQFLYDAFGNRRQAVRNGVTTRYILDTRGMSRVLYETDQYGNPQNYYIYGLGLVARVKPYGATHFYHGNNVGTVMAMTDASANITHRYSYDPFGRLLDSEEADANPFTFVGQHGVMREAMGLYYMRARYYDSEVGRFIGEDPVWHPNLYAYGDGNPCSNTDPLGLYSFGEFWEDTKTVSSIIWDEVETAAVDPIVEASSEGLLQTMWAQWNSVPRALQGGLQGAVKANTYAGTWSEETGEIIGLSLDTTYQVTNLVLGFRGMIYGVASYGDFKLDGRTTETLQVLFNSAEATEWGYSFSLFMSQFAQ